MIINRLSLDISNGFFSLLSVRIFLYLFFITYEADDSFYLFNLIVILIY